MRYKKVIFKIIPKLKAKRKRVAAVVACGFLVVLGIFFWNANRTSAAPTSRANSVEFFAGAFSGNGTTGQNSDTNQTFSQFDFRLAESNVSIKNAYLVFESQFEGYVDNVGAYTGYNLAFDACSAPCTPNAFAGSVATDTTVLAYDETESNMVRLLADVTQETQLAAYTGGGTLSGQVGYNIKRGTAVNSIAWAHAKLAVTYTYNATSTEYTNTVIYPLDATSTDMGTRQATQSTCTKNTNCPLFNYNVEIPEVGGASQRLSQWFTMGHMSGANGATDSNFSVNIEGTDTDSSAFIAEAALAGGYSAFWDGWFSGVAGYSENTTSSLEVWVQGATANFMLGGETFVTYIASSSAATKTRTVRYPVGSVTDDIATANQDYTATANVYFPEAGVAVKSAWWRIIYAGHEDTAAPTLRASAKVGSNATTTQMAYASDAGATSVGETEKAIYIIPSSEYATIVGASATTSVPVAVNVQASANTVDGVSAELMITYTYTGEPTGYLQTISLYGGQTATNGNDQSETFTNVATSTLPEATGTSTIRAAGILGSYLFSDSDGAQAGVEALMDMGLATSGPSCVNAFRTDTDAVNGYSEFYRNVSSTMTTADDQAYSTCYTNDGGGDADNSDGAKMNGIIIYTYQWDAPPTIELSSYRFYRNDNSTSVSSTLAGANTPAIAPAQGTPFRLRLALHVGLANLVQSGENFKLQVAERVNASCDGSETYADVATSTGVFHFHDNSLASDGAALTANVNDPAHIGHSTSTQTYEEENSFTNSQSLVSIGSDGIWDFALVDGAAIPGMVYCFRVIRENGSLLDGYLERPEITAASALQDESTSDSFTLHAPAVDDFGGTASSTNFQLVNAGGQTVTGESTSTSYILRQGFLYFDDFTPKSQNWQWYDDENNATPVTPLAGENIAPTGVPDGAVIKLRMTIQETAGVGAASIKYRLQFSDSSDFSVASYVAEIGDCTESSEWCYADGAGNDNAVVSSTVLSDPDACSGAVGVGCGTHNELGISTSTFAHTLNAATEYEFTVAQSGGQYNTVYFFRPYDTSNGGPVSLNSGETYSSLMTEGGTLSFSVSGLPSGTSTEGIVTDVGTTPTAVSFGALPLATSTIAAQRLAVTTNANSGYQILVVADQDLTSGGGATIPPVAATNPAPAGWSTACVSTSTGCYGYHTGDDVLFGGSTRFAPNDTFAQFTTSSAEVAYHDGPIASSTTDIVFRVVARTEQAAGTYESSINYIVTPTF